MRTLSTIGYEGALLTDFIATLKRASVEQIIDIRDVPVSRRPGFSKKVLAHSLDEAGIGYLHLKALGDPKPGREAARAGRYVLFNEIYANHLSLPASQAALQVAVAAARSTPSALLCYERDFAHCHRTLVATAMTDLSNFVIRHLGVQKAQPIAGSGRGHANAKQGTISITAP